MTQIESTDEDIAEARSLAKIPMAAASHAEIRALAERPGDATHLTLSIIAHAQTIAKLRVAREALEFYSASPLGQLEGNLAYRTLAQITQETPNAG